VEVTRAAVSTAALPMVDLERLLAGRLRELRTALGWSQREVAIRMRAFGFDWSQTNVSKIEAGTRGVRVNEAAAFALLFDVPLGELLDAAGPGPQAAVGETERAIRERIAAEILGRYPAGLGPDEELPGPDAAVEGGADG
jgi:transcriptional regulator with XRE-family HTH domain